MIDSLWWKINYFTAFIYIYYYLKKKNIYTGCLKKWVTFVQIAITPINSIRYTEKSFGVTLHFRNKPAWIAWVAGPRQWSALLLLVWKQTKCPFLVFFWSSFCWKVYILWISHKMTIDRILNLVFIIMDL